MDTGYRWSPFHTPPFDDLILYQCHVGSFDQLRTKLGYIRGSASTRSRCCRCRSSGRTVPGAYNPAFYFALESAYGRPDDLHALVDACQRQGLTVIFDVVYNHISDDSSFFNFDEPPGRGRRQLPRHRSQLSNRLGTAPAFWRPGIRDFFVANIEMYG